MFHEQWREILTFYWKLGFNLVPTGSDKRPLGKWEEWQSTRQKWVDVDKLNWKEAAGVAAISGNVSGGLACFDLDKQQDSALALSILATLGLPFTYPWLVRTGSGAGYHIWLRTTETDITRQQLPAHSGGTVDLRYNNHYAILPPSAHPSGNFYEFLNGTPDGEPALINAQNLVTTFVQVTIPKKSDGTTSTNGRKPALPNNSDRQTRYISKVITNEISKIENSKAGSKDGDGRNDTLYRAALKCGGFIGKGSYSRSDLESLLLQAGLKVGLEEREIIATIKSGLDSAQERVVPPPPEQKIQETSESQALGGERTWQLSDLGNSERLAHHFKGRLHYCLPWRKWLIWTGTRWEEDQTGAVMRAAKRVVRKIPDEARDIQSEKLREAIKKHALRSESAGKIDAMIRLSMSDTDIAVLPEVFDQDEMLLNTRNCIIDLKTGQPRQHDKTAKLMKQANAEFNPDAQCPIWLEFLDKIMDGSDSLISFLQKAVGYSLTGQTGEQVVFFLWGKGSNGKSTFLELLRFLLADYSLNTPTTTLMRRSENGVTNNDVARLRGARLVTAVETEENQYLAESTIKQLTGGDRITARFLFGEFFEFTSTFKLWLACNHKPIISGGDHGIWRRIRLVPFTVTIKDDEKDIHLAAKLQAEASGILNWAIEGCLRWQNEGLGIPEEVQAAVDAYRTEMDIVASFIQDCCVVLPSAVVTAGSLYESYKRWAVENGDTPLSQRKFGQKFGEHGFNSQRSTGGRHLYAGLGLRE